MTCHVPTFVRFTQETGMDKKTEARLRKICDAVNKAHSKGSEKVITYLGCNDRVVMDRFSSGCIQIDEIIGGGWPRGRIFEIYGPESGGKCVTSDTYVFGEHGLQTVDEVFQRNGFSVSCTSHNVEHSYGLVGEDGGVEDTTHFWWNNRKKTIRVTTKRGLEVCGTYRHPIRVVGSLGMVQWMNVQDVKPGDMVLVQKGMMIDPLDNGFDDDDAVLVALIASEGHITDCCIGFSNQNQALVEEFKHMVTKKLGFDDFKTYLDERRDPPVINVHVNSKDIVKLVGDRYELFPGTSESKFVGQCVRTASLDVQKSFLRTYFLCDGSVDSSGKRSRIEISSKSKLMVRQIQLMSLNLGAFGGLYRKEVNGEEYWRLIFDGDDAQRWMSEVGGSTFIPHKVLKHDISNASDRGIPGSSWMALQIVRDCVNSDRRLGRILDDCARGTCCFTLERLEKLKAVQHEYQFGPGAQAILSYLDQWYGNWDWDTVSEVEEIGSVPTFDFTKPTHTFWSNGLVSHNTSMCIHAMAEFQKKYPDQDVGWVDSEFSFDPDYAEKLGVVVDRVLFHQPETGEQGFDVVSKLIQNGVQFIVVDSVAALAPSVELQGDVGDSTRMAAQAALMSKALRRLAGEVGRADATLMFTNQMRDKIGVMWGEKSTTPGGRALRFYSSIRLEVKAIGQEKDGDVVVSNRVRGFCKKNKTGPPLKTANFVITFGIGIDNVSGVFDSAVENKVVKRSGTWFSFGDVRLGQGRANAVQFFRDNEDVFRELSESLSKVLVANGKKKPKRGKSEDEQDEEPEEDIVEEQEEGDEDDGEVSVDDA